MTQRQVQDATEIYRELQAQKLPTAQWVDGLEPVQQTGPVITVNSSSSSTFFRSLLLLLAALMLLIGCCFDMDARAAWEFPSSQTMAFRALQQLCGIERPQPDTPASADAQTVFDIIAGKFDLFGAATVSRHNFSQSQTPDEFTGKIAVAFVLGCFLLERVFAASLAATFSWRFAHERFIDFITVSFAVVGAIAAVASWAIPLASPACGCRYYEQANDAFFRNVNLPECFLPVSLHLFVSLVKWIAPLLALCITSLRGHLRIICCLSALTLVLHVGKIVCYCYARWSNEVVTDYGSVILTLHTSAFWTELMTWLFVVVFPVDLELKV